MHFVFANEKGISNVLIRRTYRLLEKEELNIYIS